MQEINGVYAYRGKCKEYCWLDDKNVVLDLGTKNKDKNQTSIKLKS